MCTDMFLFNFLGESIELIR